jgi:hypothetical protein
MKSLIYTNRSNDCHYIITYAITPPTPASTTPRSPCLKIKINVTQASSFHDHYFINLLASRYNPKSTVHRDGCNVQKTRNYNFEINRCSVFKMFILLPPDSAVYISMTQSTLMLNLLSQCSDYTACNFLSPCMGQSQGLSVSWLT